MHFKVIFPASCFPEPPGGAASHIFFVKKLQSFVRECILYSYRHDINEFPGVYEQILDKNAPQVSGEIEQMVDSKIKFTFPDRAFGNAYRCSCRHCRSCTALDSHAVGKTLRMAGKFSIFMVVDPAVRPAFFRIVPLVFVPEGTRRTALRQKSQPADTGIEPAQDPDTFPGNIQPYHLQCAIRRVGRFGGLGSPQRTDRSGDRSKHVRIFRL